MTHKADNFRDFSWQISSVYYGTALHAEGHEGPLKGFARILESAPRNARKLAQNPFFYFTPEIEGSVWMMIRDVHPPFAQRVRQPLDIILPVRKTRYLHTSWRTEDGGQ
jgi:hypothetical protein